MKPFPLWLALLSIPVLLGDPAAAKFFHDKDVTLALSAALPAPAEVQYARSRIGVDHIGDVLDLIGRPVYGANCENLGTITDVDPQKQLVAVRLPDYSAVAIEVDTLYDDGQRVFAPDIRRAQIISMPRIPSHEFQDQSADAAQFANAVLSAWRGQTQRTRVAGVNR